MQGIIKLNWVKKKLQEIRHFKPERKASEKHSLKNILRFIKSQFEKCRSKIKTYLRRAKARTAKLGKAWRETLLLITKADAQG